MPARKTINQKGRKPVTKDGHTDVELTESGERWSAYTGTYLSLKDVLAIEADKQK